jgi:hypothetical protein
MKTLAAIAVHATRSTASQASTIPRSIHKTVSRVVEGLVIKAMVVSLAFAIVFMSGLAGASASTTTYNYLGPFYEYNDLPNSGKRMTGSVTFDCSPCADGTYVLSPPGPAAITAISLTSGSYSLSWPSAEFAGYDYFVLASGNITQWYVVTGNYDTPTINIMETINSCPPLACSADAILLANALIADTQRNPGTDNPTNITGVWSPGEVTATPLPAALPLFATGLGALGLLGWRRKRKQATAAAG